MAGSVNTGKTANPLVPHTTLTTAPRMWLLSLMAPVQMAGSVNTGKTANPLVPHTTLTTAPRMWLLSLMAHAQMAGSVNTGKTAKPVSPPHNPDYSTKDVVIKPDGTCADGWVCEHR